MNKSHRDIKGESIDILGNTDFYWYKEGNGFVVNHPKWSTCGFGKTLKEARIDCAENCLILREFYINDPDENLSKEAVKLKRFLMPIRANYKP